MKFMSTVWVSNNLWLTFNNFFSQKKKNQAHKLQKSDINLTNENTEAENNLCNIFEVKV